MHLSSLLLCLFLGALVKSDSGGDWCYTGCAHTPSKWGDMKGTHCGGDRQSPINIVPSLVYTNKSLHDFKFAGFDSRNVITKVNYTGRTVKYTLDNTQVKVGGGGLGATYSSLQFHFHWDKEYRPGSEHMIDGVRYPMEMHLVSLKEGLTLDKPIEDPTGFAVLAFLIEPTAGAGSGYGAWQNLTQYLYMTELNKEVNINHEISINGLIDGVNLTRFYRYNGSFTTPACNETVLWTVFEEPIQVNISLLRRFHTEMDAQHLYRPPQDLKKRRVYASPAIPLPSSPKWCYDHHHCDYTPPDWHLLRDAHCDGERQSPINIVREEAKENKKLTAFTFENFNDRAVIESITNTGHAVKCNLHEDRVKISGGGLGHEYSALQFHFHWGSHDSMGSEHKVDAGQYAMEMHLVSKRADLNVKQALETENGLAVLAFFIEEGESSDKNSWEKLSKHLSEIKKIGSVTDFEEELSINDLIRDVNLASYYRYNGSLTTPSCNEAVVWTIFKNPIKVDKEMIRMFPDELGYHDVYRPTQPLNRRIVYTSGSWAPSAVAPLLLLPWLCALFM